MMIKNIFIFLTAVIITVITTITTGDADILISEDFEGDVSGWTIINNADRVGWRFDNPQNRINYTGGTGSFAIADSDNHNNKNMDTELRTPPMDMSGFSIVVLMFKTEFYTYDSPWSGNEVADVDVSINGSAGPWLNIWQETSDYLGPVTEVLDISDIAAGHANVMIRFHYYDAYNDWWWQVDDVIVEVDSIIDTDDDGIPDGDGSTPCTGGSTENCDDNCIDTYNPLQEDGDGDLVGDACDNCREVENRDQHDSNAGEDDNPAVEGEQHYGNACDPDFNNNGIVDIIDLNLWRQNVGNAVPPASPDLDINGDGVIWLQDLAAWRTYYGFPPGPGIGD